jgi:hypothetical protein
MNIELPSGTAPLASLRADAEVAQANFVSHEFCFPWPPVLALIQKLESMKTRFSVGDTVRYIRSSDEDEDDSHWTIGELHIISTIEFNSDGNFIEISTDRGAWFLPSNFELVSVADETSLAALAKSCNDDND